MIPKNLGLMFKIGLLNRSEEISSEQLATIFFAEVYN